MPYLSLARICGYGLAAFAAWTAIVGGSFETRAADSSDQRPATQAKSAIPSIAPGLTVPGPEVLLVLVRTTLIGLDQANKTGDYTVFREYGGPALKAYTVAQLGDMFANFRTKGVDLAPVAVVTPTLTETPTIGKDKILRLVGVFPTEPLQIHFEILMQNDSGSWRPGALSVTLAPAVR
jgi:hypothetical protein